MADVCGIDTSKDFQKPVKLICPPDCNKCKKLCPPDCECKESNTSSKTNRLRLILNAGGILFAIFATYMLVSTDSTLYLVFWVCYSVLRRMMSRFRPKAKTE